MTLRTLALCLPLAIIGCGDKDDAGNSDNASGGDSAGGDVTAADVQAIFDVSCAGCHTGGGSSGNLALDDTHAATVGVASGQSSLNLVEAGSLEDSYLWHKINDTQADVGGSGTIMPQGGSLSAADIAVVEDWITGGAPE